MEGNIIIHADQPLEKTWCTLFGFRQIRNINDLQFTLKKNGPKHKNTWKMSIYFCTSQSNLKKYLPDQIFCTQVTFCVPPTACTTCTYIRTENALNRHPLAWISTVVRCASWYRPFLQNEKIYSGQNISQRTYIWREPIEDVWFQASRKDDRLTLDSVLSLLQLGMPRTVLIVFPASRL